MSESKSNWPPEDSGLPEPPIRHSDHVFESLFRNLHSPEDTDAYFAERRKYIEQGHATWAVEDFTDPDGRKYVLHDGKVPVGFVHEDYATGMSRPYYIENGTPVSLLNTSTTLSEAAFILKRHHASTS